MAVSWWRGADHPLHEGTAALGKVRTAAHEHDPRRGDQLAQQQVHQQKMPETIDAKSHLEAILRVGRPRNDLQARITNDGMQRRQVSGGKIFGKRAYRDQGRQIKGHPLDLLVPGSVLKRVARLLAWPLVASG